MSYSMAWQYANRREMMEQLAKLFACMGGVATVLAAIGIFGLVAFTVSQRTREIGVRMALGASRGAILRTVLVQYAWPMAAGALAGLATATLLVRFGKAQWEVFASLEALDPAGLGAGLATFAAIALVAAMWPARRALGIDPSSALRHE